MTSLSPKKGRASCKVMDSHSQSADPCLHLGAPCALVSSHTAAWILADLSAQCPSDNPRLISLTPAWVLSSFQRELLAFFEAASGVPIFPHPHPTSCRSAPKIQSPVEVLECQCGFPLRCTTAMPFQGMDLGSERMLF